MRATPDCSRETEVLELAAVGQWPALADPDLLAHVRECESCADLAVAASAIVSSRDDGPAHALPDASVVWYRAEMQAREEAARRASQPMLWAHAAAVLAVLGLGATWWADGAVWFQATWGELTSWLASSASADAAAGADGLGLSPAWLLLGGALLACAVLLPAAFYVAKLVDGDDPSESLLSPPK